MQRLSKLVALVIFCGALLVPGAAAKAICDWECSQSIDTLECKQTGAPSPLSAASCEIVTNCQFRGFTYIGDGMWIPFYSCDKSCQMAWCVWV